MFENIGKSLQKLFGSKQEKDILKFNPIIEQIHQFVWEQGKTFSSISVNYAN